MKCVHCGYEITQVSESDKTWYHVAPSMHEDGLPVPYQWCANRPGAMKNLHSDEGLRAEPEYGQAILV